MVGNRRLGSKTTLVHCGPPACQARGYTVFTMGYEGVTHIVTQRCGYSSGPIGTFRGVVPFARIDAIAGAVMYSPLLEISSGSKIGGQVIPNALERDLKIGPIRV